MEQPPLTSPSAIGISAVTNTNHMFSNATSFNQPIGDWNTSKFYDMGSMFKNATSFNQDLNSWDLSSAYSMSNMFLGASSFNQNIGNWNTSKVTKTHFLFNGASAFNQDISDWNVSAVMNMTNMFHGASSLSDANKGKIHSSFSTNSNWPYDWSAFVTNAPPFPTADNNQTDHRLDNNSTLFPPLPKTLAREELKTGKIRLWGQILANGGSPITEVAFEVADNLVFRKSTVYPATLLAGNPELLRLPHPRTGQTLLLPGGSHQCHRHDQRVAQEVHHGG